MKPGKSISSLLGGGEEPEDETGTDSEESAEGDSEGKELTSAIYDAIESRDRDAFHEAMESYMVHCMAEPPHEGEEAGEEKKPGGVAIILGKH